MTTDRPVAVVYDPQCPVCDFYCQRVAPRDGETAIELVDARNDKTIMPEITAKGWDIDEGMVVKVGDHLYYGPEAIHQLSLVSDARGVVGPMGRLFRTRTWALRLYPVLRDLRNLLLKIMGKQRINNLNHRNRARF